MSQEIETSVETQTTETPTEQSTLTPESAKDALYGKEETTEETKTDEQEPDQSEPSEPDTKDTGEEEQKSDEKSDDAAEDKPYKLEFDESLQVNESVREDLEAFGKENNIEPEKMKDIVKKVAERQDQELQSTIQNWQDESLADKEFGGETYESNIKIAAKPLQKYGSEKLVELLEQTGLNRNAEMIRVFYRIGKAMSEGESIDTTKAKQEPDILTKLYGPSTGSN